MTDAPALPGHTLRIGVTGTRVLNDVQLYFLRPRIAALLAAIASLATEAAGQRPVLQLLSPLAEGADRLVAEAALAQGFQLVCPLPFPQPVYEEDFIPDPASLADFRRLLARAKGPVLALDGARDDPKRGIYTESRSYQAVGRLIVRNCDLLIGIWDGRPGAGPGGTADTIHFAAASGPPVVWLHATDGIAEPRWIIEEADLRLNARPVAVDQPLAAYIARLLQPPQPPHHGETGQLHKCGHWLRDRAGEADLSPLDIYLNEVPEPVWGPWLLYRTFMRWLAGDRPPSGKPHVPADATARRWFDHYQPADARANDYAPRYRSSYVWVFGLGAVALIAAAVSLGVNEANPGQKFLATLTELVALGLIGLLVTLDGRHGWHRRSIDYRLLAELCRKQQALAPLAWVVPRAGAWADTAPDLTREPDSPPPLGTSWVAWLFSAWLRDSALPGGTIDPAAVQDAKAAALRDLLKEQIDYHADRRARSHIASQNLVHWGERAFLAVGGVVVLKLVLLWHVWGVTGAEPDPLVHLLGLAGAILPALAAAAVGVRFYAELELLAEQSDAMLKSLRRARERIAAIDPAEPLASQTLGRELAGVATLMLEDLEGWARVFRGKVLDA